MNVCLLSSNIHHILSTLSSTLLHQIYLSLSLSPSTLLHLFKICFFFLNLTKHTLSLSLSFIQRFSIIHFGHAHSHTLSLSLSLSPFSLFKPRYKHSIYISRRVLVFGFFSNSLLGTKIRS